MTAVPTTDYRRRYVPFYYMVPPGSKTLKLYHAGKVVVTAAERPAYSDFASAELLLGSSLLCLG